MSRTREANSIMSKVMETLESGKYDGEPDFKLMKILDEDQIETYIEIREMFEQGMELDDMKEAMQMATNRFRMSDVHQLAILAFIDFRSCLVVSPAGSEYSGLMYG